MVMDMLTVTKSKRVQIHLMLIALLQISSLTLTSSVAQVAVFLTSVLGVTTHLLVAQTRPLLESQVVHLTGRAQRLQLSFRMDSLTSQVST